MIRPESAETFIQGDLSTDPILDVRTPSEFAAGHIPGAISFPLFSDIERAEIGTLYKQVSKAEAIQKGLEFVGPRLAEFTASAKNLSPTQTIRIHCWRGGMRSGSFAWLFDLSGFQVRVLQGGYKAYRTYVREILGLPRNYRLIGGLTGSGKTNWLHQLAENGAQILDLEKLACHRGSAFGKYLMPESPSQEQFENLLAQSLQKLHSEKLIWVEEESRMIGKLILPEVVWEQFLNAPMTRIKIPVQDRIQILKSEYLPAGNEFLKAAILRIEKKLGGERTRESLQALEMGEYDIVVSNLLFYYDKAYLKGMGQKKPPEKVIELNSPFSIHDLLNSGE
jgi:tRNA 2-selenouridine synthase